MNLTPLPKRYENLPSYLSMDYRMTDENFWIFWMKTLPHDEHLGPYLNGISLASEGPKGFEELQENAGGSIIAAFCLKDFRKKINEIDNLPITFQSKLPTWLGGVTKFLVMSQKNNIFQTDVVLAHSKMEAILNVSQTKNDSQVDLVANFEEIKKLLEKMEDILKNEDYNSIPFDRRDNTPGHPWDWIEFMKDPLEYPRSKEITDYFESNPGTWERARVANLKDYAHQLEKLKLDKSSK